ncbi:MAG: ABC transporter ATP-binding protein [Bdellovibrionota bacterium]
MHPLPLLEVEDLTVLFGEHRVLDGVSFRIQKGEVVSVVGKSGSGKTVLLRTLAGLLKPQMGRINFNFKNNNKSSIGFAFQKSPLFPWLSVHENLSICIDGEDEKNRINELLKNMGLENFKNHFAREISGGMAQKINLLRALSNNRELILMDEPFGSLDGFQREELQQFTHKACRSADRSLILVTHDIDEAILLSDRIFILSTKTSKLSHQINVNIVKPKILSEMRSDRQYNGIYQQVIQCLKQTELET